MDQADSLRQLVTARHGTRGPLRVVAITSGKGGVGKTNIAANLACVAAMEGRRVLIIDADLGLANVEILYGLKPAWHLGHVLDGTVPIEQAFAVGPHGVKVLPASSGVQHMSRLDDAQRLRLIAALDPLENEFDLVLIDSSAGIGDNVVFFVGAAQEAILVVNPEPTSLTDAYAAVKVLSQNAGVGLFNVVVNPAASEQVAREIFDKLAAVASRFLDTRLTYLGFIPRDENLQRALMAQRPLVDLFPRSPSTRAIKGLAEKLLSTDPPARLDGGLKFLWHRLLRESEATAS